MNPRENWRYGVAHEDAGVREHVVAFGVFEPLEDTDERRRTIDDRI